jgi:hypothetical protein
MNTQNAENSWTKWAWTMLHAAGMGAGGTGARPPSDATLRDIARIAAEEGQASLAAEARLALAHRGAR